MYIDFLVLYVWILKRTIDTGIHPLLPTFSWNAFPMEYHDILDIPVYPAPLVLSVLMINVNISMIKDILILGNI